MDNVSKNRILAPFNALYRISPELALKALFRLKLGYKLNLESPRTYNEKLQWIKLYDRNPLMPICCDKYLVRDYVASKGYGNMLNELLWQGFDPEEIPFDDLPEKFVIKVTHGSTFNIICTDKDKLDRSEVVSSCKKWLREKFLTCYGEWFYGVEKPRVIVEKYIDSKRDCGILDFKFFCFNGKCKCIYVSTSKETDDSYCIDYYDRHWNRLPLTRTGHKSLGDIGKPSQFEDMVRFAETLAAGFTHVRVDMFCENNEILFGELTFTTSAGFGKIEPFSFDVQMGDWFDLPVKNAGMEAEAAK